MENWCNFIVPLQSNFNTVLIQEEEKKSIQIQLQRQKLIYKKSCENICKTLISFNFKQHFQHNFPRTLKEPILVITKTINDAFMIPLFQRLMVYVKVLNIHICFNKIKNQLTKKKTSDVSTTNKHLILIT